MSMPEKKWQKMVFAVKKMMPGARAIITTFISAKLSVKMNEYKSVGRRQSTNIQAVVRSTPTFSSCIVSLAASPLSERLLIFENCTNAMLCPISLGASETCVEELYTPTFAPPPKLLIIQ